MASVIYRFRMPDASLYEYEVAVDNNNPDFNHGDDTSRPAWTKLAFHQCPNCILNTRDHPFCPVAVRLPPLIEMANHLHSYDRITVEVDIGERRVIQETTAQRALSSLLGLVMATSDCPHTVYLQPMARFHLPLANAEETEYRAASMYLLAQYFLHREGHDVDWTLSGLTKIYRELQRVNIALANRIRAASNQDTATNAVVLLDLFAKGVPYTIEDSLEDLRTLFTSYLNAPG